MEPRAVYKVRLARPRVDQNELKRLAGIEAARDVTDGMVVGLGTGSTVHYTIVELARRVREEGLQIVGIPTSIASEHLAREGGISLTTLDDHPDVDITIDGADEFDPRLNLIKGGGGALTREKIVAHASKRMVVVADASKQVEALGSTFALPVEVIQLGQAPIRRMLEKEGAEVSVRQNADGSVYLTDNGHPILDARFPQIADPAGLEERLDRYPGVVCCGLFVGLCDEVVLASSGGVRRVGALA